MGIEDITEKASDTGLEKAADAAEAKSGGKGTEQIENAQKAADAKIGQ